ncbi:MAG TPA: hypothetical protein VIY49_30050 [Bryobacteraceae bacterium]
MQLGRPDLPQSSLDAENMKMQVRALLAAGPSLIVLDNFETVSPEEQKSCTEWLSDDAPCPVLVTTRDALSVKRDGVDIASNVGVDPMAVAEAQDFLERVVANQEEALAGLDRNEIIRAADNNPLVMQWIVAQIALAQTPGTVLEELASGKGGAAQRVFDRSFYLPQLGEDGRDALLALSLLVPSASRQALAAVAGFGQDLARLNEAVKRLAALRLLSAVNAGERLAVQGLTRELTKARLDADPRASEFQRRIADFFLPYAQAHATATREADDGLMAEKDNLLGAIELTFALLRSALDQPGSVAATADVFRTPAGAALIAMFLRGNTGNEQPRSRSEYENIGRAAMVSLLRVGNPVDDQRRLPLTNDGIWGQMRDVGNPQIFGRLFDGAGFSSIGTAVVASDYLRIMWWADSMSTMAKALGAIWHLLKEEPGTEAENTAFQGLRKVLSRALLRARRDQTTLCRALVSTGDDALYGSRRYGGDQHVRCPFASPCPLTVIGNEGW